MTDKTLPKMFRWIIPRPGKNQLLYRLLFAVVVCSSCFTLLATTIQLYFSYHNDLEYIDHNFNVIQKSYLPTISFSLYKVNIDQLKIQLRGIIQLRDMVYAEVREPRGGEAFIMTQGDPEVHRDIVKEYPLSYQHPSGMVIPCGKLMVAASLKGVWARLWDRVMVILLTNGLKMFLVSLCILVIFHFLLIRHITRITHHVKRWNPDNPSGKLTMDRPRPKPGKTDELNDLVCAINKMHCKTIEYINEKQSAILALETSENNIRVITDALPVLISYIDMELQYRFMNRAYYKWFDIEKEHIKGSHVRDILGAEMFKKVLPYMKAALQGEQIRFETELTIKNQSYLFEVIYVPDKAVEGKVPGIFALWKDLSAMKKREMELKRHREELAHVSRLGTMGELTASMAHELNQPLTAILSNAQAALRFLEKDDVDIDEIKDILKDIAADDRRASDVIKRLRGFLSRGELIMKTSDMNEIIREVVTLVHSDAVMRNVSIRIDLDTNLPPTRVDRVQMQQVLLNLLINGLDSLDNAPEGSRKLIISTCTQDHRYVRVTVSDTGIGLDPEHIPNIFEPYYTTKPEGMGMGLSINRSIIIAHDGEIWADNHPGGGAAFSFNLPIERQILDDEVTNG